MSKTKTNTKQVEAADVIQWLLITAMAIKPPILGHHDSFKLNNFANIFSSEHRHAVQLLCRWPSSPVRRPGRRRSRTAWGHSSWRRERSHSSQHLRPVTSYCSTFTVQTRQSGHCVLSALQQGRTNTDGECPPDRRPGPDTGRHTHWHTSTWSRRLT